MPVRTNRPGREILRAGQTVPHAAFNRAARFSSRYSWLKRLLISRDYEYTDWNDLRRFAERFASMVDQPMAMAAWGAGVQATTSRRRFAFQGRTVMVTEDQSNVVAFLE
jgi:hypothetical protein